MTAEELLERIGRVDDDLIQEAEDYRRSARSLPARWRSVFGGMAAACLVLAVLTQLPRVGDFSANSGASAGAQAESSAGASEQPQQGENESQDQTSSNGTAPGTGDSAREVLRTPAGEYVLTGETVSQLPEGSLQLGVLFLEGEDSDSQLYTTRREYAGCMLWEGPDGTLYVQLPGEGYALAQALEQ